MTDSGRLGLGLTATLLVCGLTLATWPEAAPHPDLNPAVRQATIQQTICRPGYATFLRPPLAWSREAKRTLLQGMHPPGRFADYRLDHRVPIELGGAPKEPSNLQLQTVADAAKKDIDEGRLHHAVCTGQLPLAEAQQHMRTWRAK